jgi:hypothetical protein
MTALGFSFKTKRIRIPNLQQNIYNLKYLVTQPSGHSKGLKELSSK